MERVFDKYAMTEDAYQAVERIRQGYYAIHGRYPSWLVVFNNISDDIKGQIREVADEETKLQHPK